MTEGRRIGGWFAIPALLVVLVLVGMALSTEPKEDFERRQTDRSFDESDLRPDAEPDQESFEERAQDRSDQQRDSGTDEGGESRGGQDQSGGQGEEQRRPVVIRTEDGDIIIQLDENGKPVRVAPGDGTFPGDPSRVLTPDGDGNFVGFRVTEEGRIEPVARDEIGPGDFQLGHLDEGLEITGPDGTRVQLQPQSDGELTASRVESDGTTTPLSAEDGEIVVQSASELASDPQDVTGSEPLVIQTDAGPVRVRISSEGDLVADQPTGAAIEIDRDDLSAIRVNEDGGIELVPLDEISPDDTLLVPSDNGFDLVRPDGGRVEFRPDGENDGTTATEITPDGQELELIPNPDGSVTLSDGTNVGPIDFAEDGGTFERLVDRASDLPWPWVFGGIALLALLSIGTAAYLHRNRPDDPFDYSRFVTAGVPEDQFENFLAILLADTDPTRAIRLAFYAAERGLGGMPPRRAQETPFEWHARVEQRAPHMAKPLGPICDMFARARFGSDQPTLADRDLMVEHLRELNSVADTGAAESGPAAGHDLAGV